MAKDNQRLRFEVVVFLCGFNVMLTEMSAFRVLQTHFGSSVFIAGILLTVVLLSMTWGSYLGGHWKVLRSDDAAVVALVTAVVYVVLVNLIFRDRIIEALSIWGTGALRFVNPAAVAVILYFIPVLIMSLLFPMFVQRSDDIPGPLVGKLVAVSNVGSILGVLLTTFLFLPFAGLKQTTAISVVTLLFCCWALCRRRLYVKLALASAGVIGLLAFSQQQTPFFRLVFQQIVSSSVLECVPKISLS